MNDLPAIQRRRHSRGCKTEQFRETCRFHNRSSFEILSEGIKNPTNPLFPPVLLIRRDLLQKERQRDARERSKAVTMD
jgi:hypothetical protein